MVRVRVRPYAGLRLWPGKPSPYLGLRLSLSKGKRRGSLFNDDGAELRPVKRKPSLFNDA